MIGRVLRTARKLRGRGADELRERGAQAFAAWLERRRYDDAAPIAAPVARLVAGISPDPDALLARFRDASPSRFFAAFDDPAATVAALRARAPGDERDALRRAARVRAGTFDLLGYTALSFGTPIDWHRDPVADRRAPLTHWSRVPYLDPAAVGDHKVVWEINRQQYLASLGQAYWYTGDESYAELTVAHLEQWMRANPPKRGINWASSLEAAYRVIAWLWALRWVRRSPALTPARYAQLLGFLDAHGHHVERYLSTYFSPNTHLTGEALGLYYLGALVPELGAAARWRAAGRRVLVDQLDKQVRRDGVYFEQASQYHRYTVEIFLHFLLLAERQGDAEAVAAVRGPLAALFEHLLHVARPDGTIPLVGDDDGGRLVQLDGRLARDVRALLATGAALLGRADLAWGARVGRAGEDLAAALWLLGPQALAQLDAVRAAPPSTASRAFPDGGYWVLRDRWGDTATHALFDCGPHGAMNCGHAHADALAVELWAAGRSLIVDAGTYTYPGPERDAFRDAAAHNTVTVDRESSSVPSTGGAFQWAHVASCQPLAWRVDAASALAAGSHDGFTRLADPATHERAVLLVRAPADARWQSFLVVRDRVRAAGHHRVDAHWHLAPRLRPVVRGGQVVVSADEAGAADQGDGAPLLTITAFGAQRGTFRVTDGWVSEAYGAREAAAVTTWCQEGDGNQEVITFLLPAAAGVVPVVSEVPADGGRAFRVELPGGAGSALVVAGDGATVKLDGVAVETSGDMLALVRAGAS